MVTFTPAAFLSRGSEGVFFEKEVIDGFLAYNHHCQASIVGTCESYNEQFRSSYSTEFSQKFIKKNGERILVGGEEIEDEAEDSCKEFKKTLMWEMNRKNLSSAIWQYLTREELIERGILSEEFLGPKESHQKISNHDITTYFYIYKDWG